MSLSKKLSLKVVLVIKFVDCVLKWFNLAGKVGLINIFLYAQSNKVSLFRAPWLLLYKSRNGEHSENYIDEYNFYVNIEPKVNLISYSQALEDKSTLNNVLGSDSVVFNYVVFYSGCFYLSGSKVTLLSVLEFLEGYVGDLVIKPSNDNGGGKGVVVGTNSEISKTLNQYVEKNVNFVIQPKITQSKVISSLYPHSVNTIRVMTYRKDGVINVLSSILRVGVKHGVDNEGLSIGIRNGILNNFAIAIKDDFKIYREHPLTKASFSGVEIPNFNNVEKLVKKKHEMLIHFDLVSWDVAITEDDIPLIIEFNTDNQELNFHQLNNGPVLHMIKESFL